MNGKQMSNDLREKYLELVLDHGPGSEQARSFLDQHSNDPELQQDAAVIQELRPRVRYGAWVMRGLWAACILLAIGLAVIGVDHGMRVAQFQAENEDLSERYDRAVSSQQAVKLSLDRANEALRDAEDKLENSEALAAERERELREHHEKLATVTAELEVVKQELERSKQASESSKERYLAARERAETDQRALATERREVRTYVMNRLLLGYSGEGVAAKLFRSSGPRSFLSRFMLTDDKHQPRELTVEDTYVRAAVSCLLGDREKYKSYLRKVVEYEKGFFSQIATAELDAIEDPRKVNDGIDALTAELKTHLDAVTKSMKEWQETHSDKTALEACFEYQRYLATRQSLANLRALPVAAERITDLLNDPALAVSPEIQELLVRDAEEPQRESPEDR